jgi:hypothetical protein
MLTNCLEKQNIHAKENKMNRRNFLKTLAVASASGALPIKLLASNNKPLHLNQEEKEFVANQVHHFICRHAEHYWITRMCLLVDEIPPKKKPIYERDSYSKGDFAVYMRTDFPMFFSPVCPARPREIQQRWRLPSSNIYPSFYWQNRKCITVPTYDIEGTSLQFTEKEIKGFKNKTFTKSANEKVKKLSEHLEKTELNDLIYLLDFNCLSEIEDNYWMNPLKHCKRSRNLQTHIFVCDKKEDLHDAVNDAFAFIECQEDLVVNMIINPNTMEKIKHLFTDDELEINEYRNSWHFINPLYGYMWLCRILVHEAVPEKSIYIMGSPDRCGVLPLEKDLQTHYNDDNTCTTSEKIGMSIVYPNSVMKIELDDSII